VTVKRKIFPGVTYAVSELGIAPIEAAVDLLGIRIEQQLVVIESEAAIGIIRTVHAVAVQQSRPRFWQVAMPHLISLFWKLYAVQFAPSLGVEKADFNLLGVFGKDREIDAFTIPRGA
jgi:hypothetical protein